MINSVVFEPKFNLIVLVDKKNGVGINGKLPFRLSGDMENLKRITNSKVIIMGRTTFESLQKKPLPNRTNVVLTTNKDFKYDGTLVYHSLEDVYADFKDQDAFIFGGAKVYSEALRLNMVKTIYMTIGDCEVECDAFFEGMMLNEWTKTEETFHKKDKMNEYDYVFQKWEYTPSSNKNDF